MQPKCHKLCQVSQKYPSALCLTVFSFSLFRDGDLNTDSLTLLRAPACTFSSLYCIAKSCIAAHFEKKVVIRNERQLSISSLKRCCFLCCVRCRNTLEFPYLKLIPITVQLSTKTKHFHMDGGRNLSHSYTNTYTGNTVIYHSNST